MLTLLTLATQLTVLTAGRPVPSLLMAILATIVSPFTFRSKEPLSFLLREREGVKSLLQQKYIKKRREQRRDPTLTLTLPLTWFWGTWLSSFLADWWRPYRWTVWHQSLVLGPLQTLVDPHSLCAYWKKQCLVIKANATLKIEQNLTFGGSTFPYLDKLYWTFPMGDTCSVPEISGTLIVLSSCLIAAMPSCLPIGQKRGKCEETLEIFQFLKEETFALSVTVFKAFLCYLDFHSRIGA